MGRWIALIVALAAAFALSHAANTPPAPVAANAPAEAFSAGRAMADVRVIAKTPHPIGSPANAAVRDYLLARMQALGLQTQVQRTDVARSKLYGDDMLVIGGVVENVIGVLPGRDRNAPALALMAHYDSVPGSPGAADDAAGVASALETLRAIKTRGQPARDVILLITDGEEAGLLGAQAFFDQHPMAKRVGFAINMETRGGGGRAQMFQTGPDNGETVRLLVKTAVRPASSSLAVFLYEHMPNDTDFTVSKPTTPGLNFAFIGKQFDYHMASSTPDNLDQGSLQDMGDQVLSATREAAFAPALPGRAPDLTYSDTAGSHILAYPPAWGWGLLALSTVLSAIAAWRARVKESLHWRDLLHGVGASLYLLTGGAVLLRFARRAATEASGSYLDQHVLLAQVVRWEIALALVATGALLYAASAAGIGRMRLGAAILALAAGIGCSAFGGWDPIGLGLGVIAGVIAGLAFGRPAAVSGVWAGVLLSAFIIAAALQVLAPTTAFLVTWPLVAGALAASLSSFGASRGPVQIVVVGVIAALAGSWILTFAHGVFLGLDMPELLAAFAWLMALVFWPLAQPEEGDRSARLAALAVLLAGLAGVGLVRMESPWSARNPEPTGIVYRLDTDLNRALRVATSPADGAWMTKALSDDGGAITEMTLPGGRRPVTAAPAKLISAAGATVSLTRQADGSMLLKAIPPAGARVLSLDLKTRAKLADVTLNGRPLKILDTPNQSTRIRWAPGPEGVRLAFRAEGRGAIETRHSATTESWPAAAKPLPPRPKAVMAVDMSDSTVVAGARRFTW